MAPTRPASLPLLPLLLVLAWPQVSFSFTTPQDSPTTTAATSLRERSYSETCLQSGNCSSGFTCSQSRCICPADFFWNSTDCISKSVLAAPVLEVGNVTSTTAHLTWSPGTPWQGLMDLGLVTWNVYLGSSVRASLSSALTSYTVTGLNKDTKFDTFLIAEIRQDGKSHTVTTTRQYFTTLVIRYGGNCSALLLCNDSGLMCENDRCLCPLNQFRCSSSSCCSVNSATPSVSVSLITGNSFRVAWGAPTFENAHYVTQYRVSWRAQGQASPASLAVESSRKYVDVTGLRSATVYDVEVTSTVEDLRGQTLTSPPGRISQRTKSLYLDSCSVPSDCLEAGSSYVSCYLTKCVCNDGYFRHNGGCLSVNSYLVPTNLSTEMLTSSTARVEWSVSEEHRDAVSSYEVYFTINNNANSSTITTTSNALVLENLLPGMYHRVQVKSSIDRDSRQQYSNVGYWNMYTKPDTPGPMNMTASFVSQDFAFISFETVKVGGQHSYHVRLSGPDGFERNMTALPAQPNVAFSSLSPGQTYQIYITTQYAGLWGTPYVDSITTRAQEASVPVYGAVLLFLLPTLTLIVIIVVIVILIRRGHPLTKSMVPKQKDGPYSRARYREGDDSNYCSLEPASGATSNAATATSSSADSSATAATTATANSATAHNDYVNDEYVQNGRRARPEEKHIYANSEDARGAGPHKKKALKPKVKATPADLGEVIRGMAKGQGGTAQQPRRNAP